MTDSNFTATVEFDYGLFMSLSSGTPEARQQLLMSLMQQLGEHIDAGLVRDARTAVVRLTLEFVEAPVLDPVDLAFDIVDVPEDLL